MMKILLLIIPVVISCAAPTSKEEVCKQLTEAMNVWDVDKIVVYAPDSSHGTMEFIGPDGNLEGKDVYRNELKQRLNAFAKQNPIERYEYIYEEFNWRSSLPFSIGKLKCENTNFYVVISYVNMSEDIKMISMNIFNEDSKDAQRVLNYIRTK